jgi:hypothetical protein
MASLFSVENTLAQAEYGGACVILNRVVPAGYSGIRCRGFHARGIRCRGIHGRGIGTGTSYRLFDFRGLTMGTSVIVDRWNGRLLQRKCLYSKGGRCKRRPTVSHSETISALTFLVIF